MMLLFRGPGNHSDEGSEITRWSESAREGKEKLMAIAPPRANSLVGCDGYRVVTADTRIGSVEEIWLDSYGAPIGLAVRDAGSRRGLVLVEDVRAVDDERHWVVVDPDVRVLELEAPRLLHPPDRSDRIEAAWATSGGTLTVRPPESPRPRRSPKKASGDPPLLRAIVVLYVALALVVALVMTLTFVVPYLAT
jgi:PRC-barrel domain